MPGRGARDLLRSLAVLAGVGAAAAAGIALGRVVPAWRLRVAPPVDATAVPPPLMVDLCAERRPDGTLPAACAPSGSRGAEATLIFGGDTAAIDAALPVLALRGLDFPFLATRDLLAGADLAVVNHEAPLGDGAGDGAPFAWGKEYLYRAPRASAAALAGAGVDVASLANNHAVDHGARGLAVSAEVLGQAGLLTLGAGATEAEARRGVVVRLGSLRVGLLARCERQLGWDLWARQFAAAGGPGVAALDERALVADVAALRGRADLVVLLVHWGAAYAEITDAQRAFAGRAAAAGVDLVVGHHPHRAQPPGVERGPGGRPVPVAYSLGNYAFGTPGRPDLQAGLLLRARVREGRLTRLELVPIDVQNRRVGFRPEPLHAAAARAALAPLIAGARALGAELRLDGDAAVLDLPPPHRP